MENLRLFEAKAWVKFLNRAIPDGWGFIQSPSPDWMNKHFLSALSVSLW